MSLQIGSSGSDVEQLQNNLLGLGFDCVIDGQFGSETQGSVKDFQYTWGNLTVDGIVGPQTAAALDEAVNLLLSGQWDPNLDPLSAPTDYKTGETTTPRIIPSGITTTTPTTPGTPGATTPIASVLGGIDWKWILLGLGGAVLIFGQMGKKGRRKSKGGRRKRSHRRKR